MCVEVIVCNISVVFLRHSVAICIASVYCAVSEGEPVFKFRSNQLSYNILFWTLSGVVCITSPFNHVFLVFCFIICYCFMQLCTLSKLENWNFYKSKMADGRHVEKFKIAISLQPFKLLQ